jgi:hypothetical protein
MDHETNKQSYRLLMSIISLLLSLADMAERASDRSHAVCAFIVWIMRPAEAAVSCYLGFEPETEALFRSDNAQENAVRLAWRFRALADALICEAEFDLFSGGGARRRDALRLRDLSRLLDHLRQLPWSAPVPFDTS